MGDWEVDTAVSRQSPAALAVLAERKTLFTKLRMQKNEVGSPRDRQAGARSQELLAQRATAAEDAKLGLASCALTIVSQL